MLKSKSTLSFAVGLAIIAAGSIFHFAARAQTPDANTTSYAFGVMGVARGQTARLNVVTTGIRETLTAQLLFVDDQGVVLTQSIATLTPGKAVYLDLPFQEGRAVGKRVRFYTLLRLFSKPGNQGYVIPTLEVMDDETGRTSVMGGANPEG